MNEPENKAKLQIVEKVKASTNILITVSNNPSVDELSAALGLTALLNKMDKHATAIFGGAIPPAIVFLEPDKVFENTADSLRDFIIALDKEKADHLRYKIEGDLVKIFITPYRTTITSDDLEFSQGDYNVELVLALGVENQEHLDSAMSAHGQVLKDATVATLCAGEKSSQLGTIAWRDEAASGLSEMVAGLAESLKADKSLLDKQISTALLTGVVAATDRFSNVHTSSQVMTIAAQLMAAGADQQLIAAKLQESHEINALPVTAITEPAKKTDDKPDDGMGGLSISHDEETPNEEPAAGEVSAEKPAEEVKETTENVEKSVIESVKETGDVKPETQEPLLGGILSATTDQAAEDAQKQLDEQQNKTILNHSYLAGSDTPGANPINSVNQPEETENIDIFDDAPPSSTLPPGDVGLPLPPPLPDFSTSPPVVAPNQNVAPTTPPVPTPPPAPPTPPVAPTTPPTTPSNEAPGSTLPPTLPPADDPSKFHIPN